MLIYSFVSETHLATSHMTKIKTRLKKKEVLNKKVSKKGTI